MANKCPFFGKCGGCKFDFSAPDYREQKRKDIKFPNITGEPIWLEPGTRRRAEFAVCWGQFGLYESGTKNIIPITHCPNLVPEINEILPKLAQLPWSGSAQCLVTKCDNGIDVAITSNVPYLSSELRNAILGLPVISASWNNKIIKRDRKPVVTFDDIQVEYPSGAFLQPSIEGANELRRLVIEYAQGHNRIADLFCGLGNFTFALNADGFDIVGTGVKRDLFKQPLTVGMLKNYDCVVMDPPRAGASEQCAELAKSNVKRIIYVSCNPSTLHHDLHLLENGGYEVVTLIPVDQFVGSSHWEMFCVFDKQS